VKRFGGGSKRRNIKWNGIIILGTTSRRNGNELEVDMQQCELEKWLNWDLMLIITSANVPQRSDAHAGTGTMGSQVEGIVSIVGSISAHQP
jgi:hypothetical protein